MGFSDVLAIFNYKQQADTRRRFVELLKSQVRSVSSRVSPRTSNSTSAPMIGGRA